MKRTIVLTAGLLITICSNSQNLVFKLNNLEYFEKGSVNLMAFQDNYPEGHQGGVTLIMHGMRLASNGDLRLNETPGQWQPVPKMQKRLVNSAAGLISISLTYPDSTRNRKGFNPIEYPDLYFNYTVKVRSNGGSILITVDLDRPLPEEFRSKVGFNLELFPGLLFGKYWYLDNNSGIFPRQPQGPALLDKSGEVLAAQPMAAGKHLVIAPEDDKLRLTIDSRGKELQLFDGRYLHNNGWFVIRSLIKDEGISNVIEWVITPNAVKNWKSDPVIQVSQVGYHPLQEKFAMVELDKNEVKREKASLIRISEDGVSHEVLSFIPKEFGKFLRYKYLKLDFSSVKQEGIYKVKYGERFSHPFRIAVDIYAENVWQPTLEYFLPVQMCHMRVNEKYRVWHGLCHMDDARMAPLNYNHFDGYKQGATTLTKYKSGDHVPGLDLGGWHDAGDYDFRVESQSEEIYILTLAWEAFDIKYDETSIDQINHLVEIHQPDGKPDILQQIEHGALTIVRGYENLGRLYRGIICPTLRQYVLLGDGSTMTDGIIHDVFLKTGERTGSGSGLTDDRWVFTEDNPSRELLVAAHLAGASRALKGFNDTLSIKCRQIAEAIFSVNRPVTSRIESPRVHAAIELYLTTGKELYKDFLMKNEKTVINDISNLGWLISRVLPKINNASYSVSVSDALKKYASTLKNEVSSTPYGIPYQPRIWGAGWDIQKFGVRQYFLHEAFPDIFPTDYLFNSL
ncbi:MAG: glycoside hydrolase family 9 protein, partial [Bacteroidia bacterium]|nr:glycoside hydrolase family 9 protein [Bacteroidia bacterium]